MEVASQDLKALATFVRPPGEELWELAALARPAIPTLANVGILGTLGTLECASAYRTIGCVI
jgi:hypothetical protein